MVTLYLPSGLRTITAIASGWMDEILGESLGLVGGRMRGHGVGVADRDQLCHKRSSRQEMYGLRATLGRDERLRVIWIG